MNVWRDAALGDRRLDERVELVVPADRELKMPEANEAAAKMSVIQRARQCSEECVTRVTGCTAA